MKRVMPPAKPCGPPKKARKIFLETFRYLKAELKLINKAVSLNAALLGNVGKVVIADSAILNLAQTMFINRVPPENILVLERDEFNYGLMLKFKESYRIIFAGVVINGKRRSFDDVKIVLDRIEDYVFGLPRNSVSGFNFGYTQNFAVSARDSFGGAVQHLFRAVLTDTCNLWISLPANPSAMAEVTQHLRRVSKKYGYRAMYVTMNIRVQTLFRSVGYVFSKSEIRVDKSRLEGILKLCHGEYLTEAFEKREDPRKVHVDLADAGREVYDSTSGWPFEVVIDERAVGKKDEEEFIVVNLPTIANSL